MILSFLCLSIFLSFLIAMLVALLCELNLPSVLPEKTGHNRCFNALNILGQLVDGYFSPRKRFF